MSIKKALEKGPKQIRVASREELKMEISKYKNMTLRCLEVLKKHGINVPAGVKVDAAAGTGIKEDKPIGEGSQLDASGVGGSQDGGAQGATVEELSLEKDKLEQQLVDMNMDMKNKDEKMLEMLEEIEELKVQVYARDKSVEMQQKHIEELLEELRECKAMDNDIKILVSKKIALEEENIRLKKEIEERFMEGQGAAVE